MADKTLTGIRVLGELNTHPHSLIAKVQVLGNALAFVVVHVLRGREKFL